VTRGVTAVAAAGGLPLRPELVGELPYGAPQIDVPVRLNTNENPHAPDPEVIADVAAAVAAAAAGLNRYPDREAWQLREALAGYLGHGLTADRVWAANGSNEVLLQVLQAFGGPGRAALSFAPTYSMYAEYARDTHTSWVLGWRQDDFTIDVDRAVALVHEKRPSVVLVASPNNPTGTALPLDTVRALVAATADAGGGVVVVDEAYAEFRRAGTPSALKLLADAPRLLVTRTMSKAFSAAGVRLGYVAAAPAVVDALRVVRLPYHLSALTQAAALALLGHAPRLLARVDELRTGRDALCDWLVRRGLSVAESDANFCLFGRFADRHAIWQGLLDRGVLIRETGPEGWLRVTVGTPGEVAAFQQALTQVLAR